MSVSLIKEQPPVSLEKSTDHGVSSQEIDRSATLDTIKQALDTSTPDQLLAGLSKIASAEQLQMMSELLRQAQDAEYLDRRVAVFTAAEGVEFSSMIAKQLKSLEKETDDRDQERLLDLQSTGAGRLKVAFNDAGEGADYDAVRARLDADYERLRFDSSHPIINKGGYGIDGDNYLGYDTYGAQFNEAYALLATLEANPAGARDFMDSVRQGRKDVHLPRMASEMPPAENGK